MSSSVLPCKEGSPAYNLNGPGRGLPPPNFREEHSLPAPLCWPREILSPQAPQTPELQKLQESKWTLFEAMEFVAICNTAQKKNEWEVGTERKPSHSLPLGPHPSGSQLPGGGGLAGLEGF